MGWIGPKGEDIPPHPRQEPRFGRGPDGGSHPLHFSGLRGLWRAGGPHRRGPEKRTTVFFINGQVRNERMNDYILRPLATSQLLREATPEAAFRMMTEGIVYTQLVQVCTTLDQAVFALINGSVVFDFPGKGKMVSYFAATEEKRSVSAPDNEPSLKGAKDSFVESLRTNTSLSAAGSGPQS